jgi:hypothetical protein
MRLQPTAQLAAKKHASSLASLAMPAQKSRIIQAILTPAMLGAPEALAVGQFILLRFLNVINKISNKYGIIGILALIYNISLIIVGLIILFYPIQPGMFMDLARFLQTVFGVILGIIGIGLILLLRIGIGGNRIQTTMIYIINLVIAGIILAFGLITYIKTHGELEPIFEIYLLLIIIGFVFTGMVPMITEEKE